MARYTKFVNGRVFRDNELTINDEVWVDCQRGQIITPTINYPPPEVIEIVDLQGKIISPGFIDVQLNGAFGFDFSGLDPNMPVAEFEKGLHETNRRLIATGTTSYLPTMTSQLESVYHKIVPLLRPTGASRDPLLGAESLGTHLEGPFFAHTRTGCHSREAIFPLKNQTSPELVKKVYGEKNLQSYVKMVTLAPDRDDALDAIRELSQMGIIASIGHTAATYQQAQAGITAGAGFITHLFNAMNSMHHREPGPFGLISPPKNQVLANRPDLLDGGRPYYGLIADGIHIHPTSIRLAWNVHPQGLVLVTDAVMLMGCPDGLHNWTNGQKIVKKGALLQLEGQDTIAGSATPIIDCINNFLSWTGASVHAALQTVTTNPAAALGMAGKKGTLTAGADGDFVILEESTTESGQPLLKIDEVWKFGQRIIFATTGSLIYGYDSGIISTTLGQSSFPSYFHKPSDNLIGAIVSTYSGGQGIGNLLGGWLGDSLGRKKTIWLASTLALIGAILQTAAVNIVMFLVGRILAGFAIGLVYAVSSIYNAEIAPPKIRGVIVGLQTQLISLGYALANWVGVFGSFAAGNAAWRIPLGIQCVPALILILGLFWLPESPRWLIQKEKYDQARVVLERLHSEIGDADTGFYHREFEQIKQQIDFEREVTIKSWWVLFTKASNRRRLLLGIGLQVFLQTTGVNVVNYYQTTLFSDVGITGRNVLWVSAGYGMMGPIGNAICLSYIDKVGRKLPLAWTSVALVIDMTLIMVFSKYFPGSSNRIGQGFTIAWIFSFSFIFSLGYNAIQLVYIAEIFPTALRSRATAICAFMGTGVGLLFNQLSPKAFARIGWKYYAIFVACDIVAAFCFFMFYPETQGKTLEEIAELFGDDLVFTEHIDTHVVPMQKDVSNVKRSSQKLDEREECVEDVSR
ncbi:Facilitated trehalose transporter Tret1 [Talaromyces islandicus]|uniref:N-acetylglucosamine-6-phosphate deacetylase n=1 Tax=Talaromyces islandicus TaxID=28573 RepID=A0A0U1M8T3_TALIS|nr:Facilitated trehalose transporter Tret1 [Talaromyces islandicus]